MLYNLPGLLHRCSHCNCQLKIGGYSLSKGVGGEKGKFFCNAHYRQLFMSNPEAINYSRAGAGSGGGAGTGAGAKERSPAAERVLSGSSHNASSSSGRGTPESSKGSLSPSLSPAKKSPSPLVPIKEDTPPIKEDTPPIKEGTPPIKEDTPPISTDEESPLSSPMKRPKSKSFLHNLLSRSKREKAGGSRKRSGSLDLLERKSPTPDSDEREESAEHQHRLIHQQKPSSLPSSPEMVVRLERIRESGIRSTREGSSSTEGKECRNGVY